MPTHAGRRYARRRDGCPFGRSHVPLRRMCNSGRHVCGGVFGRIDDPDIIYVACRGVEDVAPNPQATYGSTGQQFEQIRAQELLGMPEEQAGRELCDMEDARDPEQQENLAYLMNIAELRKAAYKERARQYLGSDRDSFVTMFLGQPRQEQDWMVEVPGVAQLLRESNIELAH